MKTETFDLENVCHGAHMYSNEMVFQDDGHGYWVRKEDFDKVEDLLLTAISLLGSVSLHDRDWLQDKEEVLKYLEILND